MSSGLQVHCIRTSIHSAFQQRKVLCSTQHLMTRRPGHQEPRDVPTLIKHLMQSPCTCAMSQPARSLSHPPFQRCWGGQSPHATTDMRAPETPDGAQGPNVCLPHKGLLRRVPWIPWGEGARTCRECNQRRATTPLAPPVSMRRPSGDRARACRRSVPSMDTRWRPLALKACRAKSPQLCTTSTAVLADIASTRGGTCLGSVIHRMYLASMPRRLGIAAGVAARGRL